MRVQPSSIVYMVTLASFLAVSIGILAPSWHDTKPLDQPSARASKGMRALEPLPPVPGLLPAETPPEIATQAPDEDLPDTPIAWTFRGDDFVTIRGQITLFDADGGQHTEVSGGFSAGLMRSSGFCATINMLGLPVGVQHGSWSLRVDAGVTVSFSNLELNGKPARAIPSSIDAESDCFVEIHAFHYAPPSLRVIAADTGADLDDITLVAKSPRTSPGWVDVEHMEQEIVGQRLRSPIELSKRWGICTYLVRSPGYAWKAIEVEHHSGGERLVVLDPAAEITIQLINLPSEPAVTVSLWHERPDRARSLVASTEASPFEPVRYQNIPAGDHEIEVTLDYHHNEPILLATERLTLPAGIATHTWIQLHDPPAPPGPVPLAGTLVLPDGLKWEILILEPIGAWNRLHQEPETIALAGLRVLSGNPTILEWRSADVLPGPYQTRIRPTGYDRKIEVGPDGNMDLRIEPDRWTILPFQLPSFNDPDPGTPFAPAYESAPGDSTILDAIDPIEPEVKPSRIRIILKDGSATVPFPRGQDPIVATRIRGDGRATSKGRASSVSVMLELPEPGLYQVSIPWIDGFEPVERLEVNVREGQTEYLVVPLRRR